MFFDKHQCHFFLYKIVYMNSEITFHDNDIAWYIYLYMLLVRSLIKVSFLLFFIFHSLLVGIWMGIIPLELKIYEKFYV